MKPRSGSVPEATKCGKDGPATGTPRLLHRLARQFPHLLGLLLLAGAIFVVQREFRHLSFGQVRQGLRAIPSGSLLLSAGFTCLSFFILSFYDRMAAIHAGHRLAFRRTFSPPSAPMCCRII